MFKLKRIANKVAAVLVMCLSATLIGCGQASEQDVSVKAGSAQPDTSALPSAEFDGEPYPLSVCVVSGEKLGSMGDPVTMVYEGRQIKFCCAGCKGDFEKEPAKYLAMIDAKAAGNPIAPDDDHDHDHDH